MTAKVNDTLGDYDKAFFELEDFIESIYSIKLSLGSFPTDKSPRKTENPVDYYFNFL